MKDISIYLWTIFAGAGIGTIITFYNKRILGKLVRKLIAIDACSPETALHEEKLSAELTKIVLHALKNNKSYNETVLVTKNGEYYINPDRLEMAKIKYRDEGTSVIMLLVILIVLVISALIAQNLFPQLIQRINDFLSGIGAEAN